MVAGNHGRPIEVAVLGIWRDADRTLVSAAVVPNHASTPVPER